MDGITSCCRGEREVVERFVHVLRARRTLMVKEKGVRVLAMDKCVTKERKFHMKENFYLYYSIIFR